MRPSLVLPLSILLAACGVDHSDSVPADTGADESSSGGTYGTLPGNDEDDTTTDTEDTDSDTVDTDVEDTDTAVSEINGQLLIVPAATWETSLSNSGSPLVYLYQTANVTTGDWDGYGDTAYTSTSTNSTVYDAVTFTPGDTLATNASWWDGYSWRFFADQGNVVRSQSVDWDHDGDTEMAVIVIYPDDSYDILPIDSTGTSTGEGYAYYVSSTWVDEDGASHASQDVYVHTISHSTGTYTE